MDQINLVCSLGQKIFQVKNDKTCAMLVPNLEAGKYTKEPRMSYPDEPLRCTIVAIGDSRAICFGYWLLDGLRPWMYDAVKDSWSQSVPVKGQLPEMADTRMRERGVSGCYLGGSVYAFGGQNVRWGTPLGIEKLELDGAEPWSDDAKWEVISLDYFPFLNMWPVVCPLNEKDIFLFDSVSPYNSAECIMMGVSKYKKDFGYVYDTETRTVETVFSGKLSIANPHN